MHPPRKERADSVKCLVFGMEIFRRGHAGRRGPSVAIANPIHQLPPALFNRRVAALRRDQHAVHLGVPLARPETPSKCADLVAGFPQGLIVETFHHFLLAEPMSSETAS